MSMFGIPGDSTSSLLGDKPSGPASRVGPMILGMSFDLILCGFVVNQFIIYLEHSSYRDRVIAKILVWWCMIVGIVTTVLTIHYTWHTFVLGYGNWQGVSSWTLNKLAWFGVLDILMIVPIQVFYVLKIYRILPVPLGTLIFVAPFLLSVAIGGIAWTAVLRGAESVGAARTSAWQHLWNSSALAVDLFITFGIFYALYKTRSWGTTKDRTWYRLVRITLEVMLWPTLHSIGAFLTFLIDHETLVNYFWMMLAKTYFISLLALLNSRTSLQTMSSDGSGKGSGTIPEIRTFPLDEVTVKTDRMDMNDQVQPSHTLNRKRFDRLESTDAIVDDKPLAEVNLGDRHDRYIRPDGPTTTI